MASRANRIRTPAALKGVSFSTEKDISAQNIFVNIENILRGDLPLEEAAERIHETSLMDTDLLTRKDTLDRFLDFVHFKARTGYDYIPHMAYPSKRILDVEIENKVRELINVHLLPTIIFSLLKFFTRNMRTPDTNLYIAYFLQKDEVIKPVFDTFTMFKKDIFKSDREERALNVKRLQQYVASADEKFSSPLDAICRLKYILEYIALDKDVSHIYTAEDLLLSTPPKAAPPEQKKKR